LISYADAKALKQELEPDYQERHNSHRRLRDFYHGRYWNEVDSTARGVASIFRDISRPVSDVGPDIKLVRNLVFEVCVKYQSYLSSLPMIRTFTERPDSRRAKAQAALKERVLYATWAQANMNRSLTQIGWFGPLMGDCFHGIWPDFDRNTVMSVIRSPEWAFPVPSFDGSRMDAVIFSWKVPAARAKRQFPNWSGKGEEGGQSKQAEILEYSDDKCFYRWVDEELVNGVEHDLNFNLFDQVPFIEIPGEPWNHGAVEQSVNLVEAGNALYSLMMQAMIENVFPRLILEDPMKFDETIDFGAGATIGVNPGGKAYFLAPPTATMGEAVAMLQENERAIKQDTSMPDVSFGQFDASVITGKAVNALQGAGTGSLVEMVQGGGIGRALESWNEKALTIYQRMYTNDQVYLQGVQPQSMLDLNPRQFSVSFKGKEIIGSPRNEVVFSPYIDMHGKLVMALQAQGAGLTSKGWGREQIGISDSEAMNEEIVTEVIDDAVIGAIVAALQQDPSPEAADVAVGKATSYIEATPLPAAAPHPLLALGAGPPAAGPGGQPIGNFAGPGAGGQFKVPALPLPAGAPVPQAGAPTQAAPGAPAVAAPSAGVSLQDALAAFQNVQLQGKAYLIGEIVVKGSTADAVEIAVTDDVDRQPLQDAATFPVVFHTVDGEPKEQFAEIGTGQSGGAPPTPESLLGQAS
jgi:hypothetical protein